MKGIDIGCGLRKTKGEINEVFFKRVHKLQEEDWPIVEFIVERGFVPLCDWAFFDPPTRPDEHYRALKEALEKRKASS